jgi:hypothetical protein
LGTEPTNDFHLSSDGNTKRTPATVNQENYPNFKISVAAR